MTPEEITAEMQRKPDANMLIEWIDSYSDTPPVIKAATDAYLTAIED